MDRINGAGTVDIGGGRQGFRSEDLPTGVEGTEVTAEWLNAVQENILKVIEEAGLALDVNDWSLLWRSIRFSQMADGYFSVTDTRNDPPGGPAVGDRYIVGLAPTGAWIGHENKIALWLGAWTFIAPTPWMHVGFADRTDWRWDQTLGVPAWVQWLASETMVGPSRKATQTEVDNRADVDAFLTPKTANETPASSFEYQVSESIPSGVSTVLSNAPTVRHEVFVDAARAGATVEMGALDAGVWQINASCQVGSACPLSAVILKDGATVAENNVDNGAAVAVSALTRVEDNQVISFQFRQIAGATQQVVTVLSASRFGA
ncbi:DUF2793 domain-containing protein [Hoeflea sp.]|uniref:DUF2793 domain-containing protein n=1 Tax=Hoeflea sp. TaxID=1940281 RepID=UPI003A8DFC85